MSIQQYFTKDGILRRLKTVDGRKKAFEATATVDGHLQEMDRRARQKLGILEERAWYWWCDIETNIIEGETIQIEGKVYKVIEVTIKDYGVNQHKQCILEEANE